MKNFFKFGSDSDNITPLSPDLPATVLTYRQLKINPNLALEGSKLRARYARTCGARAPLFIGQSQPYKIEDPQIQFSRSVNSQSQSSKKVDLPKKVSKKANSKSQLQPHINIPQSVDPFNQQQLKLSNQARFNSGQQISAPLDTKALRQVENNHKVELRPIYRRQNSAFSQLSNNRTNPLNYAGTNPVTQENIHKHYLTTHRSLERPIRSFSDTSLTVDLSPTKELLRSSSSTKERGSRMRKVSTEITPSTKPTITAPEKPSNTLVSENSGSTISSNSKTESSIDTSVYSENDSSPSLETPKKSLSIQSVSPPEKKIVSIEPISMQPSIELSSPFPEKQQNISSIDLDGSLTKIEFSEDGDYENTGKY